MPVNEALREAVEKETVTGVEKPVEHVDIMEVLKKVHAEREAEEEATKQKILQERAEKFNQQNDDLIQMCNRSRQKRLEAALNAAADREDAAFTEQVLAIFRNDTKQEEPAQPGVMWVPAATETMAAKQAHKKQTRKVNVYHAEIGSASSWAITLILLLALIARLAGIA